MRRIYSNRIDHTIHSNAAGETLERFNRILAVEIDDLGALVLRHLQAGRDRIDGEDASGIQQLCTCNYELTDRATSEYGYCAACMYACDLRGHPRCGNNVGGEDRLVIGDSLGNSHHANVRKRDARKLSLQAVEWSAGGRAAEECGACIGTIWVRLVTLRVVAGTAIEAVSAGDGGGNHDAIAGFKVAHGASDLLDDAKTFMSQNGSRFHSRHGAADHVEVSAANRAGCQPDNRVIWLLNLRVRNVFQLNVADTAKHYRFHESSLWLFSFKTLRAVASHNRVSLDSRVSLDWRPRRISRLTLVVTYREQGSRSTSFPTRCSVRRRSSRALRRIFWKVTWANREGRTSEPCE